MPTHKSSDYKLSVKYYLSHSKIKCKLVKYSVVLKEV